MFTQLHHAGRETNTSTTQMPVVAASPIPCPHNRDLVQEMSTEQVYQTIQDFVDAAWRAKEAGFDGIELHGAHGYLISQTESKYMRWQSMMRKS